MTNKLNILPVMDRMKPENRDIEIIKLNARLNSPKLLQDELIELQAWNIITKEISERISKYERDFLINEIHAAIALMNDWDENNNGDSSVLPSVRVTNIFQENNKKNY